MKIIFSLFTIHYSLARSARWIIVVATWLSALSVSAQSVREVIRLDDGWKFAFGNASDPAKDFGCGTEYFNYLTKAASIHNEGPYVQDVAGLSDAPRDEDLSCASPTTG